MVLPRRRMRMARASMSETSLSVPNDLEDPGDRLDRLSTFRISPGVKNPETLGPSGTGASAPAGFWWIPSTTVVMSVLVESQSSKDSVLPLWRHSWRYTENAMSMQYRSMYVEPRWNALWRLCSSGRKNVSVDFGFLYRMIAVRRLTITPHASITSSTSAFTSPPRSRVRVNLRTPRYSPFSMLTRSRSISGAFAPRILDAVRGVSLLGSSRSSSGSSPSPSPPTPTPAPPSPQGASTSSVVNRGEAPRSSSRRRRLASLSNEEVVGIAAPFRCMRSSVPMHMPMVVLPPPSWQV